MYKLNDFDIWAIKKYHPYHIMTLQLKVKETIKKIENAPPTPTITAPVVPPIVIPPKTVQFQEPIIEEPKPDIKKPDNKPEDKKPIDEPKNEKPKLKNDYTLVKLDYLVFCDEYNNTSWTNYTLWCNLQEKEKEWWFDFVNDVYKRMDQTKFKDFIND